MHWGLIPSFAKSPAGWRVVSTINAKAETVATSPVFRRPFASRRCIVPADWFYEWKTVDAGPGRPLRQPYVIRLKDGEPLAFAGLWDAWHDGATDSWLHSYTIITTKANGLLSEIHTRMPAILNPEDWSRWLHCPPDERPPADLLRPCEPDLMEMYPSNPAVGSVRNNGPELIEPIAEIPHTGPGLLF